MSTDKEDFARKKRWEKFILDSHPKLSGGIVRDTLLAYCFAQAIGGHNGRGCHVSNVRIAAQLEKHRDTIRKYRDEAIRLGWFTQTGERAGRVEKLNVSIPGEPSETESTMKLASASALMSAANSRKHEGSPRNCPVCESYVPKVVAGEMTTDEINAIHYGRAGS